MALGENLRAETMERVHVVQMQLLEGRYTYQIIKYCTETYGVKETQAFAYIARAKQNIQEMYEKDSESAIRLIIAELQDLYRSNRNIKDYKSAHAVLKTILDHYAPQQVNLNFDKEIIVKIVRE